MNPKIELVKEILQIIDTLTPMEIKIIPESVVLKLYQLKKRVKELEQMETSLINIQYWKLTRRLRI